MLVLVLLELLHVSLGEKETVWGLELSWWQQGPFPNNSSKAYWSGKSVKGAGR